MEKWNLEQTRKQNEYVKVEEEEEKPEVKLFIVEALHLYSLNSTISKSLSYIKEEGFIMKKVYFATKADVERLHSFFGQANKKMIK